MRGADYFDPPAGALETAERYLDEALDIVKDVLSEDHPHICAIRANRAVIRCRRGECKEALPELESVAECERAVLGETHPAFGLTLSLVGYCLDELHRRSEALTQLERSLSVLKARGDVADTPLADVSHRIGLVLVQQKRYMEAREHFLRAQRTREALHSSGHLSVENEDAWVEYTEQTSLALAQLRSEHVV